MGSPLGAYQVGGYVDGQARHVAVFVDRRRTTAALPKMQLQDQQDVDIVITRGNTSQQRRFRSIGRTRNERRYRCPAPRGGTHDHPQHPYHRYSFRRHQP